MVVRSLFHLIYPCQMAIKDIGAVEALLDRRLRARAEITYHDTLVVRKSVPIFVILSSELFLMIFTRHD